MQSTSLKTSKRWRSIWELWLTSDLDTSSGSALIVIKSTWTVIATAVENTVLLNRPTQTSKAATSSLKISASYAFGTIWTLRIQLWSGGTTFIRSIRLATQSSTRIAQCVLMKKLVSAGKQPNSVSSRASAMLVSLIGASTQPRILTSIKRSLTGRNMEQTSTLRLWSTRKHTADKSNLWVFSMQFVLVSPLLPISALRRST